MNRRWLSVRRIRLSTALLAGFALAGFLGGTASAISYVLPEPNGPGDYPNLLIGRVGFNATLDAPATSAKLIYNSKPDSINVFDGPYCGASQYDRHTESATSPCSQSSLNGEVYFDFQALNNDTGALGPIMRVLGSTMAAGGGVNANYKVILSGLAGTAPSTDGKYFVNLKVSWAKNNDPACVKSSPLSNMCQTGDNFFRLSMSRSTDLITYAVTNDAVSPLAVEAGGPNLSSEYSDFTFQFAPACTATASSLKVPLKWTDADYGESNQKGSISWQLYDDSAAGGPTMIATQSDAQLGGQNEAKTYAVNFLQGHKYRWIWRHVDQSNGVQLYLPFDSYNYVRVCPGQTPPPGTPPGMPPPGSTLPPTTTPPGTPPPTTVPPTTPPGGSTPPPTSSPQRGDAVITKPYFRVLGGDVAAGQGMNLGATGCAVPANFKAGAISWNAGNTNDLFWQNGAGTSHAAFVLNHLQEFATFQNHPGVITDPVRTPSALAFANTIDGQIDEAKGLYGGKFNGLGCITDYFAGANSVEVGNRKLSALPKFPAGGRVPNGTSLKYYIDGNLYIDQNVSFSGSYPDVSQIPSFSVVVRGNIFIDAGVKQLNGVYIAEPSNQAASNGIIYTCATDSTPPFNPLPLDKNLYDACNNQLFVYGSFTARQIRLMRTYGDLNGNGPNAVPAEYFIYSPELWLSVKPGGGVFQPSKYDSITSLPPVL